MINITLNPTILKLALYFSELNKQTLSEWVNEQLETACHNQQKELIYREFLSDSDTPVSR